jgi:hypothetical protein
VVQLAVQWVGTGAKLYQTSLIPDEINIHSLCQETSSYKNWKLITVTLIEMITF